VAATLKTRKPVHRLTLGDLAKFPVWEYAVDEQDVVGQDETWVRPLKNVSIPKGRYSLTVAADFTTANGRSYQGFVGVTTADADVEIGQGVILDGRYPHLFVPNPDVVTEKTRVDLAAGLGLHASEVFPISYKLRAPVQREKAHRSGQVR